MPMYECRFFNEKEQVVRIEILDSSDDRDARREARNLMIKTGRFSGYELLEDGRKIDAYKAVKLGPVSAGG